jgi:hypothetical protein
MPHSPLSAGVRFQQVSITAMGCHKDFRRALRGSPALEVNEMRRIDTNRCEEMYRSLTPLIQEGDPQAIKAAMQVLALKAGINGYKSSEMEVSVSPGPNWSSVLSKDQTLVCSKRRWLSSWQAESRSRKWHASPALTIRPTGCSNY